MTDVAGAGLTADRPFPGLRPFDFPDHDFFFGRDHEVYSLYRLVDRSRFIAVVGSSGSGKSSLVRAGLLPLLKEENESPGGRRWIWKELRPGNAPIARLAGALASLSNDDDPVILAARQERIAFELRQSSSGSEARWERSEALARPRLCWWWTNSRSCFAIRRVNQAGSATCEKPRDTRTTPINSSSSCSKPASSANNVHVLLTMRSDFIGECARFHGLPEAVSASQFLVPSLTREQLEEVIRTPIERAGATIEGALVQRLLNDSGSDLDQLPVLQHCLSRLWERAEKDIAPQDATASVTMTDDPGPKTRRLTEQHYADIGRMSEALSRHADEILQQAGPEHVVEKVFRSLSEVDKQRRAIRRALSFSRLDRRDRRIRASRAHRRRPFCRRLFFPRAIKVQRAGTQARYSDRRGPRGVAAAVEARQRGSGRRSPRTQREQHTAVGQGHHRSNPPSLPAAQAKSRRRGDAYRATERESLGWLQLEEKDGETYRSLLSWADNEKGALPFKIAKSRQRRWASRHPTSAWAERNGGGFDRVNRLTMSVRHTIAEFSRGVPWRPSSARRLSGSRLRGIFDRAETRCDGATRGCDAASRGGRFSARSHLRAGAIGSSRQIAEPRRITVRGAGRHARRGNWDRRAGQERSSKRLKPSSSSSPSWPAPLRTFTRLSEISSKPTKARSPPGIFAGAAQSGSPDDSKLLSLLYHSLWRMGDAIADRDTRRSTQERALKVFLEAEQLARQVAAMTPEDSDRQGHIVFVLQKIGDVRQSLNDWPTAIAVYGEALKISQGVADRAPANRDARRQLANSLSRLGQALTGKGDLDAALERHRAAFKIRTDLWAADRNDDVMQSNLAGSHRDIARTYTQSGDLEAALADYHSAIAIQENLQAKDPTNATWQGTLAPLYAGAGDILRRKGDLATALEQYRKAYTVRRALALRDPSNPGRQEGFAAAGMAVADVLVASKGDLEEAVKLYRGAIESVDDLRPRYDRSVFLCYIKIGDILKSRNDFDSALAEYKVASAIARKSATRDAASTTWQRNLEISYAKIGDLLAAQGRARAMSDHYREALDFVEKLAAQHPENTKWAALAQSLKTQTDKEER